MSLQRMLGIDIGGTKIALALVAEDGTLLRQERYASQMAPGEDFVQKLCTQVDHLLAGEIPGGIGIGIKGLVAVDHRTIIHSSVLENMMPLDLCGAMGKRYGIPCYLDNDVHAAATAELYFGHGRAIRDFTYVNLGTGLAVGVVAGGQLVCGTHNMAGEWGTSIDLRFLCGEEYQLETLVSGGGLVSEAQRLLPSYPAGMLAGRMLDGETITGKTVLDAHRTGDELAAVVVDHFLEALSRTLVNLTLLLDPAMFVLGGGTVSDGYLLPLIRRRMEQRYRILQLDQWVTPIALTALGADDVGVLGAASICLNAMDMK